MMSLLKVFCLRCLLVPCGVSAILSTYVQGENLVIATGEWPPYVSSDLEYEGVTARIVRAAFEAAGDTVDFTFYPWSRTLLVSEEGEVDASFPWSHREERAELHFYSDPIGEYGYVFFHLTTTPFRWQRLEDLEALTIGATYSYNYGDDFIEGAERGLYRIEWASSDELNWRKLMAGRIDLFPQDRKAGYAQLLELFPGDSRFKVTHNLLPLKPTTTLHLLLPKSIPESANRLERFNTGLRMLTEDGQIERYLQESWQ
ncbi:substrate-binding periplasmic protein [Marinobacter mobilis]|uniref:substrate-binding periplasmic protein n=1 Tax=Marinobacter mobilis TaxID=488533 RepID=UPI0035C719A6